MLRVCQLIAHWRVFWELGETFGILFFHLSNFEIILESKLGMCMGLVVLNPRLVDARLAWPTHLSMISQKASFKQSQHHSLCMITRARLHQRHQVTAHKRPWYLAYWMKPQRSPWYIAQSLLEATSPQREPKFPLQILSCLPSRAISNKIPCNPCRHYPYMSCEIPCRFFIH